MMATDTQQKGVLNIEDATPVAEGGVLTFKVTLTGAIDGGVDVTYITADDSATEADSDYTAVPEGVLHFVGLDGESQTITIATTPDTKVEQDEVMKVVLSGAAASNPQTGTDTGTGTGTGTGTDTGTGTTLPPSVTISRASATGSITNNDKAALAIENSAPIEEGGLLIYKVRLSAPVDGGLKVSFATSDDTATLATHDYVTQAGTLQFIGNQDEELTISVTTNEDEIVESDERVKVTLSNIVPLGPGVQVASLSIARDTATGVISNDDLLVPTIGAPRALEGSKLLAFPVQIHQTVQDGFTIDYGTTSITAKSIDNDYTPASGSLKFDGMAEEVKWINVTVIDDQKVESDETLKVTISNLKISGMAMAFDNVEAIGTILNDDKATFTISDAPSVIEGGDLVFKVKLSADVQGGVSVDYASLDGTATVVDSDYPLTTGTLEFEGLKDETLSITVTSTADDKVEIDELMQMVLGAITATEADVQRDSASDFSLARSTGSGVIINDDYATLSVSSPSAPEGNAPAGGFIDFVVTLSNDVQGGVKVDYETLADTAGTFDPDYVARAGSLLFQGVRGEQLTVRVLTVGDSKVEPNELLQMALRRPRLRVPDRDYSQFLLLDPPGVGTILNDDQAQLLVDNAAISEGGSLVFHVRLSADVQGGATVNFAASDNTAELADNDYVATSGVIVLQGSASEIVTVSVPTRDDNKVEADELLRLAFSDLAARNPALTSSLTLARPSADGTIRNNDTSTLSIAGAAVVEGNSLKFPVTLTRPVQGGLSVAFSTIDGTATAADSDYSPTSGMLSFAGTANEIQWIVVPTIADTKVEVNESLSTSLGVIQPLDVAISAAALSATVSSATGTINDDDVATLTIGDVSVLEGGQLQFPVTLLNDVDGGLTVDFATNDATATRADLDYTSVRQSLRFTGPASTQTLIVKTTADTKVEADETLTAALSNLLPLKSGLSVSRFRLPTSPAVGTILNDDSTTLRVSDVTIVEGGNLQFTLTSSAAVQGGFRVDAATADGTALTLDSDYTPFGATLQFTGNANESKSIYVASKIDSKVEANETVQLLISNLEPLGAGVATGNFTIPSGPALGTIQNDDKARLTVVNTSADEGQDLVFQVRLGNDVDGGFTVDFSQLDGTATAADSDYAPFSNSLVFHGTLGEMLTVAVPTVSDTTVEAAETLTLALSNPLPFNPGVSSAAFTLPAPAPVGTINNNDTAALTIGDAQVVEGGVLLFPITLSRAVQGGLKVAVATSDGTALVTDADYTPVGAGSVTFAGTEGEVQYFQVQTTSDNKAENDETMKATLGIVTPLGPGVLPLNIVASKTAAIGTIGTDDSTVSMQLLTTQVNEDGTTNLVYRFARLGVTNNTLTANFTVGGTATLDTDYTASGATSFTSSGGSVTFAAGATYADVTLDPIADTTNEANETVIVTLISGANYGLSGPSPLTGTILNDDPQVAVTVGMDGVVEGGVDRLAYTFTRTGSLAAAVTINFAVGGTATYLTDYTVTGAASFAATAGSVRFAAGASTSVIYVTPKNDANYEPDETVVLTVKPTLGYFAGPSPATGTIINDDIEVTVAVAPSSVLEDSGNSLVYTFTRRGVLTNVVTANFSISGTATLNTDYTFGGAVLNGLNGAVTFAPGAETVQVTATPISDAVNESNETVIVTVGTGFGYLPAAVKTATGTVANDDPQVSVWPAPSPVYEDSGSKMIFTFTRTGPLNQYLTVNFAVNGTAVYGVDYTQTGAATFGTTSGTVRFVLGASVVQVVITPKSDKTVEPDETVSLIVQGGTGYFVGSLIVATTTIRDDDSGASGEGEGGPVSFDAAPAIPLSVMSRQASDSLSPEALSPMTTKGTTLSLASPDSAPTAGRLRAFSARNLAAIDSVFGGLAATAGAARQTTSVRLESAAVDAVLDRLNRID